MRADPRDQFAQPMARRGLRLQRLAQLRLLAAAQHRQRQRARDVHRHRMAKIVFDQRERELDAGSDAGRGPHRTVVHVDALALHAHLRPQRLQLVAGAPVRGGLAAVEQAGHGERERAAADTGDAAYAGATCASQAPMPCSTMAARTPGSSPPATISVSMAPAVVAAVHVPATLRPAFVMHGAAGRRCDVQAIGAGMQRFGLAEHAGRAGDVDRLDAVERDQHDVAGRNRGFFVLVGLGGHS